MKDLNTTPASAIIAESLALASGELGLAPVATRSVEVEFLGEPDSAWGRRVDAVEAPFADDYDEEEYGNRALQMLNLAELRMLEDFDGLQPRDRLLDIGCGTGRIALFAAKRGIDVTALDQTARYAEITADKAEYLSRGYPAPRCIVAPVEAFLARPGVTYDAITAMFAVLNHCEDWRTTLAGLSNRVRPAGRLVLSMYGSPDGAIFQELENGMAYEPAILVRRTEGGLLLGSDAEEVLPALFPYPAEVVEQMQRTGLDVVQREPFLTVTAFYPRDPSRQNIAAYIETVNRRFGKEVASKLSDCSDDVDELLVASLQADYGIDPSQIDQAAYFGLVGSKVEVTG